MRSGVRLSPSFFVLILCCSTAFPQGAKLSPDNPAENERDRPQERARWFLRGRNLNGKPASEQLHRAYEQKLNNRRLQYRARINAAPAGTTAAGASPRPFFIPAPAGSPPWTFLGPAPTATAAVGSNQQNYGPAIGRVTAVAVDQGDPTGNTVYIGGASGGVWKTTSAVSAPRTCDSNGVCAAQVGWTPLTDGQATLTVGSIALQPGNSNLILVGTGEANNSADSYYGLGILRSTDAGATWNLISSAICPAVNPACSSSGTVSFHGLGFTRIAFSNDNTSSLTTNNVVATAAAASGGITIGAETSGSNARGIYVSIDAGVNWQRANVRDTSLACTSVGRSSPCVPDAGSANSVVYNYAQKKFFANLRFHGIYSSSDGINFSRLACQPGDTIGAGVCQQDSGILGGRDCPAATSSGCPLYRADMAVVPGRDEMYVWIYNSNERDVGMWQTRDGGLTWTQISTTGIDFCGDGNNNGCGNDSSGQGTYNLSLAAVPSGAATDLYAGGVNQYKCTLNPASNPTCASSPFLNLTHVYSCSPAGNIAHVHPDEHGIDFLGNDGTGAFFASHSSFSPPVFFGNDGGVYRVLQSSSLTSGTCPASGTTPASLFDNLNSSSGFSMVQFVGFAHAANDASTLVGGTQDNGSPAVSNFSPPSVQWRAANNGDGGFAEINALNAGEWFTSNPAPLTSGGGIQRCTSGINCSFQTFLSVVTQDKIGGDSSAFYTFYTLDPQASTRMLVASCRVWRGNSDGTGSDWSVASAGGNPLTLNLDNSTASSCASGSFMVNTIAAGGPCNGACNPGITPASATGGGSQVVWAGMEGIADASTAAAVCPSFTGSASPCGGQVWRTLSADSGAASWTEVSGLGSGSTPTITVACTSAPSTCNINPKHYPISGIALDPRDASGKTAYVTVMGFGVGHVFRTTDAGATWALLDGDPNSTGLPDAPADAVVADPSVANLVYVGTDVGVFSSTGNGTWTELGPASGVGSLPNVVITQLKIYNNPNDSIPLRLRASTYGRGIWEIPISPLPGYTLAISNPTLFAFAGQTATYNGTITAFNGYSSPINVICTSGGNTPPSTCPTSASPVVVSAPYGSFTVTAGSSTTTDFDFNITAVGTDSKVLTTQSAVILHSVDFSLGSVPASTVGQGNSADVSFTVSSLAQFTGSVALSCAGLPAGTSCNFSQNPVTFSAPGTTASVTLTIPTTSSTTTGSYTVNITGTSTLGSATKTHSTSLALMVSTAASQSFQLSAGASAPSSIKPTQSVTVPLTLSSQGSYAGTLALTCSLPPTAGSGCTFSPPSVTLSAATPSHSSTLAVNTTGAAAGTATVTITARDSTNNASTAATASYSVMDYSLALLSAGPTIPGGTTTVTVTAMAQNGYKGKLNVACAASPLTCTPATTTLDLTTNGSASATETIAAPANTAANTYAVTVNTNDSVVTTLTHNQTVNVTVQDFSAPSVCNVATTGCSASAAVTAGGKATFNISVAGLGGFTSAVALACSSGAPSLSTCSFSTNPVSPGASSVLTIQTTAPSVAQLHPPASRRTAPFYALWLTLPVVGIMGIGVAPRNRGGKLLGCIGLVVCGILLTLSSCGGGGGSTMPPVSKPGTPAGSYTITVTGTSGSGATALSHSTQITLTVQ